MSDSQEILKIKLFHTAELWPKVMPFLRHLEALKYDDLILPFFSEAAPLCAQWIRDAANSKKFDWPANVKFVGFHNIRHGVIATVRRLLGDEEARLQAGHSKVRQIVGATHNYSRPNEARGTMTNEEDSDDDADSYGSIDEEDAASIAKEAAGLGNEYVERKVKAVKATKMKEVKARSTAKKQDRVRRIHKAVKKETSKVRGSARARKKGTTKKTGGHLKRAVKPTVTKRGARDTGKRLESKGRLKSRK
jgi:hypothetical protein